MKEELNIAAILKDKPKGIKLYDKLRAIDVHLDDVASSIEETIIWCNGKKGNNYYDSLFSYSKLGTERGWFKGLQILKPSKEMQDWNKFAWKKGDALTDNISTICLFDGWANDDYTEFKAKYTLHLISSNNAESEVCKTNNFVSVIKDEDKQSYLTTAEMFFNVNLTKGSLEIEKPEFKDGDIVFSEDNREIAIFKRTHKGIFDYHVCWSEGSNMCYDISSIDMNLRPATDSEKQQLFDVLAKEGKRWNSETKQLEDLPKKCELKPFDYVLINDGGKNKIWQLYQYAFECTHQEGNRYYSFYHMIGGRCFKVNSYKFLPYNDQTAHLLGTNDEWEG